MGSALVLEEKKKAKTKPASKSKTALPKGETEAEKEGKTQELPLPQVQVLLDEGWTDFAMDECKQIRDNVDSGIPKFAMQLQGAMYIVEMNGKEGTQTNAATKKTRQLRVLESAKVIGSTEPRKKQQAM